MQKNIFSIYSLFAVLAVLTFSACEKDNTLPDRDRDAEGPRIRFYNASPNSKPVNIWVNGQKFNGTAVTYYTAFPGEYFIAPAGQASLKVMDTASTNPIQYFEVTQTLDPSKHYSFFAIDSFAKLKPLFLEDNITKPAEGKAHMRFLNLSPNSVGVDIMITKFNNITLATPDTLVKALAFGAVADFRPMDIGVYDLKIIKTGTPGITVTVAAVTLLQDAQYTTVVRGFVGGTGTGVFATTVSSYRPTY